MRRGFCHFDTSTVFTRTLDTQGVLDGVEVVIGSFFEMDMPLVIIVLRCGMLDVRNQYHGSLKNGTQGARALAS